MSNYIVASFPEENMLKKVVETLTKSGMDPAKLGVFSDGEQVPESCVDGDTVCLSSTLDREPREVCLSTLVPMQEGSSQDLLTPTDIVDTVSDAERDIPLADVLTAKHEFDHAKWITQQIGDGSVVLFITPDHPIERQTAREIVSKVCGRRIREHRSRLAPSIATA